MTKYRKLKSPPAPERRAGAYGVFVGVCVMALLLSGSVMGVAMFASGQTFSDLVEENAVNWKVKDVSLDFNPMNPNTLYPVYYWDYRFPSLNDEGYIEFEFNDADDEWFTVYLDNVWEGSLSVGATIEVVFEIRGDPNDAPVFEARRTDDWTQVCLHFTTTGGSYEFSDLWFSEAHVILTSFVDVTDSIALNDEITLKAVLVMEDWVPHSGTYDPSVFEAALADIHEIGLSFGRTDSVTSGVALSQGEATFVLKSFELAPA
ncbi:MAG: hypothetical protein AB1793_02115 [Candidatus Thermoplasmatota archaeon]